MSFSNFCVMPWINLSTDVNGSLRPCCKFAQPNPKNEFQLPNMREGNLQELWNDERFLALRQAFLDNKKPKECQSCWDEEAAGILSFRKNFVRNKKLSLAGINFSDTFSKSPITLDLKLNNVCNLKCRICGAQASSTFVKEFQERLNVELPDAKYWVSNKILGNENEEILTNWAPNIRHIEMTGGEPMVSPENLKVLELLIQSGAEKNITLMLNTNATQYNTKFIDLLKQFKQVKLCLSIDDIGDRLEYERYPTEWNVIQNNIEKFMILQNTHNNIFINVVPTVSIFNVYYLTDY